MLIVIHAMNKSLESSQQCEITLIKQTGKKILCALVDSVHGFETFMILLSTTVWQSKTELVETWIHLVAEEEYKKLLPSNEYSETEDVKKSARKYILKYASSILDEITQNLSKLQQIKSELLILHTLVHTLSVHDQDRIIAKEMGIPYKAWQQMMGFFSHNPEFINLFQFPSTILQNGMNQQEKI